MADNIPRASRVRVTEKNRKTWADPAKRERARAQQKALYDPSTPEGRARREMVGQRVRERQAQARKNAIDAEINRRILEGILAPAEAVEADTAEGGEQA